MEKAQVQHLGFLRGLGRHRDALGVWVFVERNPCEKGLGDEQGEISPSPPKIPAAGHFLEQASSVPGVHSGVTLDP